MAKREVVPCTKDKWPQLHPLIDLSRNHEAAAAIFKKINPFFRFKVNECEFSGYAQKTGLLNGKRGTLGPCFYVQIWDDDLLYRTVGFRGTGYQGILHVEAIDPDRIYRWRDDDPITRIADGLGDAFDLPAGFECERIWYVDGDIIEGHFPWTNKRGMRRAD